MNYVTELLTELAPIIKSGNFESLPVLAEDLHAAIKFVLPPDGIDFHLTEDLRYLVRLPYPLMALELPGSQYNDNLKMVVLLSQPTDSSTLHLFLFSGIENTKIWFPPAHYLQIDLEALYEKGTVQQTLYQIDDMENHYSSIHTKQTYDSRLADAQSLYAYALSTTLNTLAGLNAKNISTVSIPAPKFINIQRQKKNKVPLYEYKTLSIFLGDAVTAARPRDRLLIAKHLASQKDFRLFSVRGHFKKKNGKLFWWNSHTRGSKNNGVIEKTYKLENKNANC